MIDININVKLNNIAHSDPVGADVWLMYVEFILNNMISYYAFSGKEIFECFFRATFDFWSSLGQLCGDRKM